MGQMREETKNSRRKKYLTLLLFSTLISILTITFASSLNFFIYPSFIQVDFANDPQFFYLSASMLLDGKTMYVDIADHKGLYIFWYHALGQLMGGRVGLYFLEIVYLIPFFFFLGLAFMEIKEDRLWAFFWMLGAGAIYVFFGQAGSSAEIELPWIASASYFYLRGYRRNEQKSFMIGNILWGVQAGISLNGRPSDCMFALGPILAYGIMMMRKKEFLIILRDAGLCLGALLLVSLPALIASISGGYFALMFEMVFLSNFFYVSTSASSVKIVLIILLAIFLLLMVPCLIFLYKRINREEWIYYVTCLSFVGILQMAVANFDHYWIPAIPFVTIYLAVLINEMKHSLFKTWVIRFEGLISVAWLLTMIIFYPTYYYATASQNENKSVSYIKEAIPEEERALYTLGIVPSGLYSECGIVPQYRNFTMQVWHSNMDEDLMPKLKEFILSGYVHYFLVDKTYDLEEDVLDLNGESFSYLDSEGKCPLYRVYVYEGNWLTYAK